MLMFIQQFQNGIGHLLLRVVLWEKRLQILHLKADTLGLIGFFLRHNLIDIVRGKRTLLCRLFHTDALCVGRGAVVQAYSVQQDVLLFFGQIGKLNGGAEGNHTLVYLLEQFGNEVG